MRRMTFNEFCKRAYELVGDEYIFYPPLVNQKTPIKYKHKVCGTEDTIIPSNFLSGARCKHCQRKAFNKRHQLSNEEFVKRLRKVTETIVPIESYKGMFKTVKCKCLICGYGADGSWNPFPANLLRGKGCPNCAGNAPVTVEQARQTISNITKGQYQLISGFENTNSKVKIKHLKCNRTFPVIYYSFTSGGTRCPFCQESHGEQAIAEILDDKNIRYIRQMRFKNCRDKRALPFDFYLPDYNLCIEYDGEQHSLKRSRFYSKNQQYHDKIKNEYCKHYGIRLMRIPYTVSGKQDINNYLIQRLPKKSYLIPPIKIQGIKTKLISEYLKYINDVKYNTWYEPFMGSGVVGFNALPRKAIFSDINPYIISFYNALKKEKITPELVRQYLINARTKLEQSKDDGTKYYNFVRDRFNQDHSVLDFLLLQHINFNGMIRFNRNFDYNIPYGHKPNKLSDSYISRIVNQVNRTQQMILHYDWQFICEPWQKAIQQVTKNDLVYFDPPYYGRSTDYYNSWDRQSELNFINICCNSKFKYIVSTWISSSNRKNEMLDRWTGTLVSLDHKYYVSGRSSKLKEGLILNIK